jgi:hypothetical protein
LPEKKAFDGQLVFQLFVHLELKLDITFASRECEKSAKYCVYNIDG